MHVPLFYARLTRYALMPDVLSSAEHRMSPVFIELRHLHAIRYFSSGERLKVVEISQWESISSKLICYEKRRRRLAPLYIYQVIRAAVR